MLLIRATQIHRLRKVKLLVQNPNRICHVGPMYAQCSTVGFVWSPLASAWPSAGGGAWWKCFGANWLQKQPSIWLWIFSVVVLILGLVLSLVGCFCRFLPLHQNFACSQNNVAAFQEEGQLFRTRKPPGLPTTGTHSFPEHTPKSPALPEPCQRKQIFQVLLMLLKHLYVSLTWGALHHKVELKPRL